MKLVSALPFLVAALANAQQSATYLQGGDPFGVQFLDGQRGWVTLDGDLILRTQDGGLTWTQASTPDLRASLRGIHMLDETHGYVVGEKGTVLKTADGGLSWVACTQVHAPELMLTNGEIWPSAPANLHQVHFFDPTYGFVVGDDLTVQFTLDGGANWQQASVSGIHAFFTDIFHDDPFDAYDLHFFSPDDAILVLDEGWIARSSDAGRSWQSIATQDELDKLPGVEAACNPQTTNLEMWSVDFFDDGDSDSSNDVGIISGGFGANDGYLFRTIDGGAHWTAEKCIQRDGVDTTGNGNSCSVTPPTLYSAAQMTPDLGISVGYSGSTLLRQVPAPPSSATEFLHIVLNPLTLFVAPCDPNSAWWNEESMQAAANPALDERLVDVPMNWVENLNSTVAFQTGTFGVLQRVDTFVSGGKTVATIVDLLSEHQGRMDDAEFCSTGLGFQVGQQGQILRSLDFGSSVERVRSSAKANPGNDWLYGVDVSDDGGWVLAVGSEGGTVSTQAGAAGTWSEAALPSPFGYNEVDIVGSTATAYVVGNAGRVRMTMDSGQTWSNRNLPSGFGFAPDVLDVEFLDSTFGFVTTTNARVYYTSDGGLTWSFKQTPGPSSERIQGISVSAPLVGVVGSEGGIYVADITNPSAGFVAVNTLLPEQADADFEALDFVHGTTEAWVAGRDGLVLHFDGSSWRRERSMTSFPLRSVTAVPNGPVIISSRRAGLASF